MDTYIFSQNKRAVQMLLRLFDNFFYLYIIHFLTLCSLFSYHYLPQNCNNNIVLIIMLKGAAFFCTTYHIYLFIYFSFPLYTIL